MKIRKYTSILVIGAIAIVLVLCGLIWIDSKKETDELQKNTQANPSSATSTTTLKGSAITEKYVTEYISVLSPIKEQVGGKFYVTKIEARGGIGMVSYEDGHISYIADMSIYI